MSISENLWVYIPNAFAGVRKPNSETEVIELTNLLQVKGIISLLDDEENLSMYKTVGVNYLHLPVKGGTAPTLEQLAAALEFQHSSGGLVAVHCTNGRRRTGTLLGALCIKLLQNGSLDALCPEGVFEDMKTRLLTANPDCDLRDSQWEWLKSLIE